MCLLILFVVMLNVNIINQVFYLNVLCIFDSLKVNSDIF